MHTLHEHVNDFCIFRDFAPFLIVRRKCSLVLTKQVDEPLIYVSGCVGGGSAVQNGCEPLTYPSLHNRPRKNHRHVGPVRMYGHYMWYIDKNIYLRHALGICGIPSRALDPNS